MITATLKTPKGETVCEISLPRNPSELSLVRYVSFLIEVAKIDLPGKNVVAVMAKAVSEFSGVDIGTIFRAKLGEDWTGENEAIEGIKTLYGWCVHTIGQYKGVLRGEQDHTFDVGGELFNIPVIRVQQIGGTILPDIVVAEAIEAFETVRAFSEHVEKGANVRECVAMLQTLTDSTDKLPYMKRLRALVPETESVDLENSDYDYFQELLSTHGDEDGNYTYSRYLTMMAILCRKEGEKLPVNESERRKFIAERSAFFQGIDAKTAMDVDFFLLNIFSDLNKTHHVIGSLIRPVIGAVVETKKLSEKPMPVRSNTRKQYTKGLGGVRSLSRSQRRAGLTTPK